MWDRHVAVREAIGAGPLSVAVAGRWGGRDLGGAARLYARRHRLAEPAAHLASTGGRLSCVRLTQGWPEMATTVRRHDSMPLCRAPHRCQPILPRPMR